MNPEHSELLRNYAQQMGPPAGQAGATLGGLVARVGAGDPGPSLPPAPAVPPPVADAPLLSGAAKLALGFAGLGLVGALALWGLGGEDNATESRGAPHVALVTVPAQAAPPTPGHAQAPPAAPPHAQALPAVSPKLPPPKAKPRTTPVATTTPSDPQNELGAEMELMSSARLAIGRGESKRALKLLDEHKRRFRVGAFAKEREVSRVTAYCALGRTRDALRVARTFVDAHPNSLLSDRLRQSCAGEGLAQAKPPPRAQEK